MTAGTPHTSGGAALARKGWSICQRAWAAAIRVLWADAGGIDDTKLPSGFAAPHQRGSRMVRNLWHLPF